MIIDTLASAENITDCTKTLKIAFDYMASHDLATLEIGKFDVADGVKAMYQTMKVRLPR